MDPIVCASLSSDETLYLENKLGKGVPFGSAVCAVFSSGFYFHPSISSTNDGCMFCPDDPFYKTYVASDKRGADCSVTSINVALNFNVADPRNPSTTMFNYPGMKGLHFYSGTLDFNILNPRFLTKSGYTIPKLQCLDSKSKIFQQTCDSFATSTSSCLHTPVPSEQAYYTCTNPSGTCISQAIAQAAGQVALVTIGLIFLFVTCGSGLFGIPSKSNWFQKGKNLLFRGGEDEDSADVLDSDEMLLVLEQQIVELQKKTQLKSQVKSPATGKRFTEEL